MKNHRRSLSILLAMLLCVAMLPAGAFASSSDRDQNAQNTGTETAEEQDSDEEEAEEVRKPKTVTSLRWYKHDLKFTTVKVVKGRKKQLDADSEPLNLRTKARKNYRKLKWDLPRQPDSIDGFIILRRTGKSDVYKQIKILGPKRTYYHDKQIKKKKKADYTVVGYRKDPTGYAILISPCTGEGRAPGREYQNPSKYIQITDKISKHGLKYYTSPVLVNKKSSKEEHIEALIETAYKYKGDKYKVCSSGKPGKGLDCSGLVMQACYGAGVDLWPVNPWRHRLTKYEWESRNIAKMSTLRTVRYRDRERGDLIFFCNSGGTIIHVAIYLGNNKIIHSTTVGGHVVVTGMGGGAYGRPCRVKRIFN